MANILIFSTNPQMIDQCRKQLSPSYSVMVTDTFSTAADVILIDSLLIDQNSDLLKQTKSNPGLYLIFGLHWPENKQISALTQGASGYFDLQENWDLLPKAIESVKKGEIWINRKLVPLVIKQLSMVANGKVINSTDKLKLSSLSKREIDVATMIATGLNNKQIANQLAISERTVKAHLTSIFKKLNITDRLHLAILVKETQ